MPNRHADPPPMTEAEARRRLGEAYRILLDLAARRRAQEAQAVETTPMQTTTEVERDQHQ